MFSDHQHPVFILCKAVYPSRQCIMKSWLLISHFYGSLPAPFFICSFYLQILSAPYTTYSSAFILFFCLAKPSFCTVFFRALKKTTEHLQFLSHICELIQITERFSASLGAFLQFSNVLIKCNT